VGATIQSIVDLGVPATSLTAAIGPSIGPCCYQVDHRVREAFEVAGHDLGAFEADGSDHWRLDLWAANATQLIAAGVPRVHVHLARLCTAHHLDVFYSFRAEGSAAGRMMAVVKGTPAGARTD
jgi:copper oxidase (laccase) domain-containing protein